jgi:hypothetical protein
MANNDDASDDGTGRPGGPRAYLMWEKVDETLVYIPPFILFFHVLAFTGGDMATYRPLPGLWAFIYLLIAPLLIWRVGWRTKDRGDPWRAASILGFGGLWLPLPLIPDTPLTTWPGLMFTLPLVVVGGVAAQIVAVRAKPPHRSSRFRALLLMAGAVVWAAAVVGAYVAPRLDLDEHVLVAMLQFDLIRLPIAIVTLVLVVKLVSEAAKSFREGDSAES